MASWFAVSQNRKRFALVIVVIVAVVAAVVTAWQAVVPFVVGLTVAYIILPAVNWVDDHCPKLLKRKRISRPLAIVLVYLVGLGFFGGLLAYFVPAVIEQGKGLTTNFPRYLQQVQQFLAVDVAELLKRVPPEISEPINNGLDRAIATLTSAIQKGVSGTLRQLWNTVSFVIGMAIIPFWMFYILNDNRRIKRSLYSLVPESAREDVSNVEHLVDTTLSAYLRGQLVLCVLVGSMVTIMLLIFGVDMALLLGTFSGLFEIIPILGPYLGAIPSLLVVLLTEPSKAIWVVLSFFAIQWAENTFMVPRITGDAVRLHPALVMFLVTIASQLGGIVAMLFVVPLVAVARDVVRYLYLRTTERGATPALAMQSMRARQP